MMIYVELWLIILVFIFIYLISGTLSYFIEKSWFQWRFLENKSLIPLWVHLIFGPISLITTVITLLLERVCNRTQKHLDSALFLFIHSKIFNKIDEHNFDDIRVYNKIMDKLRKQYHD